MKGAAIGSSTHRAAAALERLVDEVVLGDERDVVVAGALARHEVGHEARALAVAVARPSALAECLRKGNDGQRRLQTA